MTLDKIKKAVENGALDMGVITVPMDDEANAIEVATAINSDATLGYRAVINGGLYTDGIFRFSMSIIRDGVKVVVCDDDWDDEEDDDNDNRVIH